jgi:REP element-mobilizing transposase RayT
MKGESMGRLSRNESCPDDEINVVHCINRCVRRGFLCGKDVVTGNDYEHRREWIRKRFEFLAASMGIEVLGYAILSNHFHVVLRNRPDIVAGWSDDEVAARWWQLCPARRNKDKSPAKPTQLELDAITGDKEKLAEYRKRLSSVSWFMRFVTEYVARRANHDDEVTGRFWEGRFKCQPLLDDAAILACMQYVDLNPIRAGIAKSIESSHFTSGQDRLTDLKEATRQTTTKASDDACEHGKKAGWLQPVALEPKRKVVRQKKCKRRCSNKGFLSLTVAEYLQLLDWTGRQLRRDGKLGRVSGELKPVFERVGISPELWVDCVKRFRRWHSSGVGRVSSLKQQAERHGPNRSLNTELSRAVFP